MRQPPREYPLYRAYYEAANVEEAVNYGKATLLSEIDWNELIPLMLKPSKITLLHHCIFAAIRYTETNELMNLDDIYEVSYQEDPPEESLIEEIYKDFKRYDVPFVTIDAFLKKNKKKYPDSVMFFRDWFYSQENAYELLWEKLTDQTFHLLYSNRRFLHNFSLLLSSFLSKGEITIPGEYLTSKGKIPRVSFPQWVKRAVYFRDNARCVICQVDLSGLLSTDRELHYDHIVPLDLFGTNDPTNVQLLCRACNENKLNRNSDTSFLYPAWW